MNPVLSMNEEQRLEARKDRLRTVLKLNGVPIDSLTKRALDDMIEAQQRKVDREVDA